MTKRDFERVSGFVAGSVRTRTLIQAAQQFALVAAQAAQNPPHTASEWSEIARLWEQAINQLRQVPVEDAGYVEAQKFQAQYQRNLGVVRNHQQAEESSFEALSRAKNQIETMLYAASSSPVAQNQLNGQVQGIINQLETVQTGTTSYLEAQALLRSARTKLLQLQPK